MSIFNDHIAESDEILSQWYIRGEDNKDYAWNGVWGRRDGWLYPIRYKTPADVYNLGDYCTPIAAYDDWRPGRTFRMAEEYHIDQLKEIRIDRRHYLRTIQKAYDKGEIRAHTFNGQIYYCWVDVCGFNTLYEIELIIKYCKKHKFHWNGPLES